MQVLSLSHDLHPRFQLQTPTPTSTLAGRLLDAMMHIYGTYVLLHQRVDNQLFEPLKNL